MKQHEYEAYPNPFHVLMFAGEKFGPTTRQGRDASAVEPSPSMDDLAWAEMPIEARTQPVEQALLSAVSNYFQSTTAGRVRSGTVRGGALRTKGRDSYREEGAARRFTRVIVELRRLNKQLADSPYVAAKPASIKPFSIAVLSDFESTALSAVNFALALNIALPIDCIHLRRWYDRCYSYDRCHSYDRSADAIGQASTGYGGSHES